MSDRVILHVDCNSFFASVESALAPGKYDGVPMAVAGNEKTRHGIILAKNEVAKRFGVKTAEPVAMARRKCPGLVTVAPHYEEYVRYSHAVKAIFSRYTDMIESFGIDEAWLDVTGSRLMFGDGETIANRIREEVKREIGITVSVGVSFNKVFAKLGSDYKKPDAVTVISKDNFRQIVYPLDVSNLLFVGSHTADSLTRLGIHTIGELAATDPEFLLNRFGKAGEMLYRYARGEDDSPVEERNEAAKSISNGFTFSEDLVGADACRRGIESLCEEIGTKLKRSHLLASTVTLRIKDVFLKTVQKQQPLNPPTDIAREIAAGAFDLYLRTWRTDEPVRMMSVAVSGLVDSSLQTEQISLFDTDKTVRREKTGKREYAVDEIRDRFGSRAIRSASDLSGTPGSIGAKKPSKHE